MPDPVLIARDQRGVGQHACLAFAEFAVGDAQI
jgi:hypothetical protein